MDRPHQRRRSTKRHHIQSSDPQLKNRGGPPQSKNARRFDHGGERFRIAHRRGQSGDEGLELNDL